MVDLQAPEHTGKRPKQLSIPCKRLILKGGTKDIVQKQEQHVIALCRLRKHMEGWQGKVRKHSSTTLYNSYQSWCRVKVLTMLWEIKNKITVYIQIHNRSQELKGKQHYNMWVGCKLISLYLRFENMTGFLVVCFVIMGISHQSMCRCS